MIDRELAHAPAAYNKRLVHALQAMEKGEANAGQQTDILKWLLTEATRSYDMSYRPNDPTSTSFAEGRRFVGLQVVKLLKLNAAKLKDE